MENRRVAKSSARLCVLGLIAGLGGPLLIALLIRGPAASAIGRLPDLVPILALLNFLALWPRGGTTQLRRSTLAGLGFLFFGAYGLASVLNETSFFGLPRPDLQITRISGPLVLALCLGFSARAKVRRRLHRLTSRPLTVILVGVGAALWAPAVTRIVGFDAVPPLPEAILTFATATGFAAGVAWRIPSLREHPHPALVGVVIASGAGAIDAILRLSLPSWDLRPDLALWLVTPAVIGTLVEDVVLARRSTHAGLRAGLLGTTALIGVAAASLAAGMEAGLGAKGRLALLAIITSSGLSVLFAAFAHRRLVARIDELVAAARAWTEGSLDAHVVSERDDEIGRLTLAFNGLVERLDLQKNELEVLAKAVRGASDAIVLLDDRLRVRFANASFLDHAQRPLTSLVGRPLGALVETPDSAAFGRDLGRALARNGRFAAEIGIAQSEGRGREFSLVVTDIAGGGYLALFRDTSVLRRLERERAEFTASMVAVNRSAQLIMDDLETLNVHEVTVRALQKEYGVHSRIWILDEETDGEDGPQDLRLAATSLPHGGELGDVRTPLGESLAGRVAVHREPVICKQPEKLHRLFAASSRGFSFLGPQAAFPLVGNGRVLGVLEMTLPDQGHERSIEVLVLLAKILSGALANAELYRRSYEQQLELQGITRRLERAKGNLELRTTELHDANEKLVEADRAKSLFLSTASHELRTPVGAAVGLIDLILDGAARDEDDARDLLQRARGCMVHLRAIVNDVLDVARIEAGRLEIERSDVGLSRVFEEVCNLTGAHALEKPLHVRVDAPDDVAVHADRQRLVQVLVNLMGNAIRFTEEGSIRMTAVARRDRGFIEIRVRDTGIGLEPQDCRRVFDVFTQADGSDTRKFGGSGLGLAISQRLAAMMGGTLRLESEGPGQGACAVLTLPPARGPKASRNAERLIEPRTAPPRGRVLLVDGDPAFLARAGAVIAEAGFQVMCHESVAEAWALAFTTRPDWVLADYALPHEGGAELENGLDLARAVFGEDALNETRFGLLTGLDVRDEPLASELADDSEIHVLEKSDLAAAVTLLERSVVVPETTRS